jgi:hypothetical protein
MVQRTTRRRPLTRLAVAASLAALPLAASASPAAASVTLGQLAPGAPPSATCVAGPVDAFSPTVGSGNSYVAPATGTITSWQTSAAAGAGQSLAMKIFRKVADPAVYVVAGHDGPRSLAAGVVNSFPVSIPVKLGDVLGINDANATAVNNACSFSATGGSILEFAGDLADRQSGSFDSTPTYRTNVTAVLAPTNTFSLGSIARNKKQGTATLTVSVPNPGRLSASGNGVTASSAPAVSSEAVTAPGPTTLLIRARGKKKRRLNDTGKVKLNVTVTYTPTGGDPSTQLTKLTLKKRL